MLSKYSYILNIPNDLFTVIFKFLKQKDIMKCSQVCKQFKDTCRRIGCLTYLYIDNAGMCEQIYTHRKTLKELRINMISYIEFMIADWPESVHLGHKVKSENFPLTITKIKHLEIQDADIKKINWNFLPELERLNVYLNVYEINIDDLANCKKLVHRHEGVLHSRGLLWWRRSAHLQPFVDPR